MEQIKFEEIPQELLKSLDSLITNYSVGLIGAIRNNSPNKIALIGSGTLIEINGIKGILTAHHVTTELKNYKNLGLSLLPFTHRFDIATEYLTLLEVALPPENSTRPDLSVIILPQSHIGTVSAYKNFWNISYWREDALRWSSDLTKSIWLVHGFIDEQTKNKIPERGFQVIKAYQSISGYSPIERYYEENEFDYFEVNVSYKSNSDIPQSFEGMSGGGLWQASLYRSEKGDLTNKNPLLLGMAFYQTSIENNKRYLICHGKNSIYRIVSNTIVKNQGRVSN